MKTSDQFKPSQSFAVLLVGPPGSGKTVLSTAFPKPYIADCDNNLVSVRTLFPNRTFMYDTIDIDDSGKTVEEGDRWRRLLDCLDAAFASKDIETVVVDSLSKASDYLIAHILKEQKVKDMRIQDWGTFKILMTRFITKIRSSAKFIVCVAHERYDKDEMSGVMMFKVTVPGALGDSIGALFTDMWRCECTETGGKYKYIVRTKPTARISLKTSLIVDPTFEFSWDMVKKFLQPI